MKKNYIYLASLLLLLTSCRKEEVILDEPIITIDPPTEIEGAYLKGQISDNEAALVEGAVIKFYQDGELVGEAITDSEGNYNSTDIPLQKELEVTLAIEEEAYTAKYKRTSTELNENTDLRLIKKSGAFGEDKILMNPGDPDLIKLYGTFTDKDGNPLENAHSIIAWEFTKISDDTLKFDGVADQTDENGYIELLAQAGQELFFFSVPDFDSYDCIGYISEEEENILDWGLYFDNLGVVNTDQELIEQSDLNFSASNYYIYGDFQNCDGSPVTSGEVTLIITYIDVDTMRRTYRTSEFNSNGEYIFDIDLCGYDGDIDIELNLINQDTFATELKLQNISLSGIHLAPLKACDDLRPIILISELNLDIGSDYSFDFIFENMPLEEPYNFFGGTNHQDVSGAIIFTFSDIVLGENIIPQFAVGFLSINNPDPFQFNAPGIVIANVTDISNGNIIGTLEGNVETEGLGTQLVTGDFLIRYE